MLRMLLQFKEVPKIGFAHHFRMEKYRQVYGLANDHSMEITYIKSGRITAELYGKRYNIEPGSIVVLFRHLPFRLYSADGSSQSHCVVQLLMDYQMEVLEEEQGIKFEYDRLLLPFVMEPCPENESLKKELYAIVSAINGEDGNKSFATSLTAMGILSHIDSIYRSQISASRNMQSILEYKVKKYIIEHIDKEIALGEIAEKIGKTPNYINSVFKTSTGMTILQYINHEKVRMIAELLMNKGVSFKAACENVGIQDVSYGYRLFKKHIGMSPGRYVSGEQILVD